MNNSYATATDSYRENRIISRRYLQEKALREKQLHRRITIFVLLVACFISLIILLSSIKGVAANKDEAVLYKYYTSIEVHPGDTLYNISLDYIVEGKQNSKQFIRDVVYMNNLNSEDSLIAGTHIVIPYFDVYHN